MNAARQQQTNRSINSRLLFPGGMQRRLARPWIHSPRPSAGKVFNSSVEFEESRLDLNEYLIENETATFYLRVAGESMIDELINNDDIVVVDRSRHPARGRVVIACLHGGEHLLVKKLGDINGKPALMSCNRARVKDFPPIMLTEESDAEIWGVVVGVIRKFA